MPNYTVPASAAQSPYYLFCTMEPSDGLAHCGQPVRLKTCLYHNGKPSTGEHLQCIVKWEARETERKEIVTNGTDIVLEFSSQRPGWMYLAFIILDKAGKPVLNPGLQVTQRLKRLRQPELLYEIGILFDAEKIIAMPSCPDDFDAFWDNEIKRLQALPMAARLTELPPPDQYQGKVKVFSLEINCLGHFPVTGYLAFPADARQGELPACLDLLSMVWQDAPLEATCAEAMNKHALEMYLSWHGQPTGQPDSWYTFHQNDFYQPYQDMDDPQKWTMHDMFLRALRGLHYLKQRPEWNGKELVVRGGSLAGIEAIALAALDKDIDVVLIDVPTGCEFNVSQTGRSLTWMFHFTGRSELLDNPQIAKALAYHDGVNFAHRITCETYVCTGLADEVCFPSNVCAFYNGLTNTKTKKLNISPTDGHYGTTVNASGDSRLAKLFRNVTVSQNQA